MPCLANALFGQCPVWPRTPHVTEKGYILSLLKPMETINLKEEVRSLIDRLPENFTWSDLISAIYLRQAMKSEPIQVKA